MSSPDLDAATDVLSKFRRSGTAAAAKAHGDRSQSETKVAAFFDVDNTIMRGSSLFHFASGLAKLNFFSGREIFGFGLKQLKFVLSGSEDPEDVATTIEAALSFVQGRRVDDLIRLGESVFDQNMVDKFIPGSLALAQKHLDAGHEVWLVTATPIELAEILARRLGLTGALGTVSESRDGVYTGRLEGYPLHGLAKAEAIRALSVSEGLNLAQCSAYSDSANDIPMLSSVGHPTAVNPDSELRSHAKQMGWDIADFRRRAQAREYALPAVSATSGVVLGLAAGYFFGRIARK